MHMFPMFFYETRCINCLAVRVKRKVCVCKNILYSRRTLQPRVDWIFKRKYRLQWSVIATQFATVMTGKDYAMCSRARGAMTMYHCAGENTTDFSWAQCQWERRVTNCQWKWAPKSRTGIGHRPCLREYYLISWTTFLLLHPALCLECLSVYPGHCLEWVCSYTLA